MQHTTNTPANHLIGTLAVSLLIAGVWRTAAWADGGQVRAVERHADLQVSVFTSPNPLRAGPVDVSVLVQDATTGEPIAETEIRVRLIPRSAHGAPIHALATASAATNKLLRAALVELPHAGWWDVEVSCIAARARTDVRFSMEAAAPLPRWLSVWPWFTWPLGVVILFAIHRRLVAQRHPIARNIRYPIARCC